MLKPAIHVEDTRADYSNADDSFDYDDLLLLANEPWRSAILPSTVLAGVGKQAGKYQWQKRN